MLWNLTDYVIIPFLASGMLQNFTNCAAMLPFDFDMLRNLTDCATMLPFDFRHVMELHGLPNDGCQVPRSDQIRVASQQTDGPRTKLGYGKVVLG